MSSLPYVRRYRDLVVYQKARQLARKIFEITAQFPKEEMFALTDQVRRSSRSIGAQVAEAWAKRRYERHFLSKPTELSIGSRRQLIVVTLARPTHNFCLSNAKKSAVS